MMGRQEGGQSQFFYAFDLDEVVPPDHLVRQIDAMLDLSWVHKEFAPYYSPTGLSDARAAPGPGQGFRGVASFSPSGASALK
jgi:hypothetical protein